MTLSSKKVIKLRTPIHKVTVLTDKGKGNGSSGTLSGGMAQTRQQSGQDDIKITQAEMQQELQLHYNKGLEEGKLSGYEQAENDYGGRLEILKNILVGFEEDKQQRFRQNEELLLKMALKISEKILKEIPAFLPEMIRKSLSSVFEVLKTESSVEIIMHPKDVRTARAIQESLQKSLPQPGKITFKPDAGITRGGCIVETDTGKIDARIETQVDQVIREMWKEIANTNSVEKQNESSKKN